mgnify:CR=1 FL=1
MSEITIKLDGADAVRERLREISSRVSNLSPILRAIGDRVVEQTKRRFESQGPAPDGTPWAPLKPATLAAKKHKKILTETGHLRDSIRYRLLGFVNVNNRSVIDLFHFNRAWIGACLHSTNLILCEG